MPVASPVSDRRTVVALLLLTFATGLVDAVSVLFLGHVFVANMTGNVIFLRFWFVPHSGVDMVAALVSFTFFVLGTIVGGRFARHLNHDVRLWLATAMSAEVVLLVALSALAGHQCAALSRQREVGPHCGPGIGLRYAVRHRTPVRNPGIGLAAFVVAASLAVFHFGKPPAAAER